MYTATCANCGSPKEPANYSDVNCPACATKKEEAMQHFAAENPSASQSDILYAGRQALAQIAHHANRNFVDPRQFGGAKLIPVPPQRGDRGGPA